MNLAISLLLLPALTAPSIKTVDLAGNPVTLPIPGKATGLFFVGCECPIANRGMPEFNRIVSASKEVAFYFVYADGCTKEEAAKHRKDYEIKAPAILDSKFKVSKFFKATVTPESVLFDKNGKLVYQGRINDSYSEHNVPRTTPSKNELRDAIQAMLNGKAVAEKYVAPVGCAIPYLQ